MDELRVAALASLTPPAAADEDPLSDPRTQQALCDRWAADQGYVITRQLLGWGMSPDHRGLWADVDAGQIDLFVTPSRRVLARIVRSVEEFTAECARRGIRLETVRPEEPDPAP
ncbi:hypothetical protein ACN20G_02610 [Streptomyces sp. BI20]|uniref:hypothetical protein n=1 Tax=Streptomyces sp. BI20 TaxID=3403460 RepID=UPI003C794C53